MSYTIGGIQQIGVGVRDLESAWKWYRLAFGLDVPVFQDEADAPLMTRYTGGTVQRRNAVLALNLRGGAGFEIWQYKSRAPQPCAFTPSVGDIGLLAGVMKSSDVGAAYEHLQSIGADLLGFAVPVGEGGDQILTVREGETPVEVAQPPDAFSFALLTAADIDGAEDLLCL